MLLKNAENQLPLDASSIKSIAVIGGRADVGVISGGGSAQVDPAGGNPVITPGVNSGDIMALPGMGLSPLAAIRCYYPASPSGKS
ncbi:hypothetical protein NIIDMKKI_36930 [Mycobacterium kansasii]|uniref:Glycoside hydrolase family 3 C-terminal domain-containing protein n=1 Tax=Mycobacterium kansasii TaxID=1768 RepID=A0A7G1IC82_MYCKA|nr:hypothetical protein NIIDMKKI_36930 [Mycobacterium kansasii]